MSDEIEDSEIQENQDYGLDKRKKVFDRTYRVTVNIHETNSNKVLTIRAETSFEARCLALSKMLELNYELDEFHVAKDPQPYYKITKEGVFTYKDECIMECEDIDASKDIIFIIESKLAPPDSETKIIKQMEKLGWEL